jgi:hypothetical protein
MDGLKYEGGNGGKPEQLVVKLTGRITYNTEEVMADTRNPMRPAVRLAGLTSDLPRLWQVVPGLEPVLRIRDVYPGYRVKKIPGSAYRKNSSILTRKLFLSSDPK